MRPTRRLYCTGTALLTLAALLGGPSGALAGGFDYPANGTEALGRGGAFTAKADSPLALEYNVAGLAGQRGTRLLFDNNLHFDSYSFQRIDPQGMTMYPLVSDQSSKPFYAPWFGVTSDFGYFDRWTFAVGLYGPSSVGKRTYPADGPQRYDVIATDTLIIFPSLAVAVRINRFFDLGLEFQDAIGTFSLKSTSTAPILGDAESDVDVKSWFNPILQLGVLLHPNRAFDVGFNIRSAANLGIKGIEASGTLNAQVSTMGVTPTPQDATFTTYQPWEFRLGARYAYRKGWREVVDFEVDGIYQVWSAANHGDAMLVSSNPVLSTPLSVAIPHQFHDTYGIRLGGALNQRIGSVGLTVRLGFFYDSAATDDAWLRADFNTLAKIAGTAGIGVSYRGVTLNVAYAYIHGFDRTTNTGQLQAIDGVSGMGSGPAVNNGTYSGNDQILSLGLLVQFDELVRGDAWARRPRP